MKGVAVAAAVLALAISLLWLAGEQHRLNCLQQHHTACTVLPWQNGKPTPAPGAGEITGGPPGGGLGN